MAAALDLTLAAPKPGTVLSQWLYDEIRSAILDGRLKRGARLPPTRGIAKQYNISRGTVVAAFERLYCEGYLDAKVGAGTYINTSLPEDLLHAKALPPASSANPKRVPMLSQYARRLGPAPGKVPPARAFRIATPALNAFPLELWAQIASRRLRKATSSLLTDVDAGGYWPLREAVSDYLGTARGVKCTTEQVIIVAGIQQALDLTARLVLDPGDSVWLEDPCYPGVAAMFKALGAKVIAVPVDQSGLHVAAGRRLCDKAKLAYVTPAHQFPLGATMTVDRRLALLDWARRRRAVIFEDDYDSEYRYSGRPISALQSLDGNGTVVLAGSFSKVLFPSLRLGYVVVPEALVDKFASARFTMDRHSAVIDQAILCDFMLEGHFGRHIRRMRELYASRLALLRNSIAQKLAGVLDLPHIEAGVQTAAWLAKGIKAEAVELAAARCNVEAVSINRFAFKNRLPEGLLLGFGAVDEREICRGLESLAIAIDTCQCSAQHAV